MRTKTEHVVDGYTDVLAWGPQSEVQRWLARASETGRLASFTVPRPHADGVAVRARFRSPRQVTSPRPAYRTVQRREWSVAVSRRTLIGGGVVVAGLSVVGLLIWLAVRGVTAVVGAAWSAVTAYAGPLVAIGLVGVIAAGWWLTRDRGKAAGGRTGACPGVVHHCARCPDH